MRIPIKALKDLCHKYKLTHAVLLAHQFDGKKNSDHVVTYGETAEQCAATADAGNRLKDAIGWPESLHATPSRVKVLEWRLKNQADTIAYQRTQLASQVALIEKYQKMTATMQLLLEAQSDQPIVTTDNIEVEGHIGRYDD